MYVLLEDKDSLKKYNTFWDKVSADIQKEFDSKPVYSKMSEYQNKSYCDVATNLHDKEILKYPGKEKRYSTYYR